MNFNEFPRISKSFRRRRLAVGILFAASFSLLFASVVYGWQNPTAAPPGGNLPAPINVGSVIQTKTGGLNVMGNVGIGTTTPAERLSVVGNIIKTGTVSFVEDYPGDPSKQIVYVSLEGPEVGTYIRGTADCQNNEATIVFPDYFRLVTGEKGLTAQLTPRLKPINLYIKELNNEKLVVGCGDSGSFDYLVNGLRKGYENHQVIRQY